MLCFVECSLAPCFVLLLVSCDVWLCYQLLSFPVESFFVFFVLFVFVLFVLYQTSVVYYCLFLLCFACHLSVALLTGSHSHVAEARGDKKK